MNEHQPGQTLWSIILAGGEGTRTRPLIERWLGHPLPKQFCSFVGTRSMLEHTWTRADCVTDPERKVTVMARQHQLVAWAHIEKQGKGRIIFQPENRGTAAGVFLPLTYVLASDPHATVVIYPSDHFVCPEDRFVDTVRQASRLAQILSDRLIVLGVTPTQLEVEYGWLEKGHPLGWSTGGRVYQVQAFVEKPNARQGRDLMSRGALWNTLVTAAKATTLWHLGWQAFPGVMDRFARLKEAIGSPKESQILQAIYHDMPHCNFSSDLLQRLPEGVAVMELDGVLWSDWGNPARIAETLRQIGKQPAFNYEHLVQADSSHFSTQQVTEVQ